MQPKRFHKWVEIASPDCAVETVAQHALASRLSAVQHYLILAAEHYRDDVEYVHQLRVWCRRADAAVRTFGEFLPAKQRKKLRRTLRILRRSAGAARDDDVLLERFQRNDRQDSADIESLIRQVEKHRSKAQREIVAAQKSARDDGFGRLVKKSLRRLEQCARPSRNQAGHFGRQTLLELSHAFGRSAAESSSDIHDLHQVRIAGKRLRYAIEMFALAFPPPLRDEIYPRLEEIQDRLGDINDHATAQQRFQRWIGASPVDKTAVLMAKLVLEEAEALELALAGFQAGGELAKAGALRADLVALLPSKLD